MPIFCYFAIEHQRGETYNALPQDYVICSTKKEAESLARQCAKDSLDEWVSEGKRAELYYDDILTTSYKVFRINQRFIEHLISSASDNFEWLIKNFNEEI